MNHLAKEEDSTGSSDTVERLLETARRLFATGGFEGTSVRSLTQEAGANLGAVTYHFESKEALYQAVLERVMEPLRKRVRLLADSPLPAPDRLELFVQLFFQHFRENVDLPRFFFQEIVLGDDPSPQVLDTVRTGLGTLTEIIREGQEEGTIVDGDPVLMGLTVLSQPIYLSLMPRFLTREDLRGEDLPQPEGPAQDHVMAALRRAFVVPHEETP